MVDLVMASSDLQREPEDTTVYSEAETVGENTLHRLIVELLRPQIESWLAERGVRAFTGADQFVYFRRGDTRYRVAPDVYVMPGADPSGCPRSWKTWLDGVVPSFALEVVSTKSLDKDYIDGPRLYDQLGTAELVLFDPEHESEPDRHRLQVFRRARGGLTRVIATDDDRVQSEVLGCHLVAVGHGSTTRLRVGVGPTGGELFPTGDERYRREHTARVAAEAEVARLRALLGRDR